MTLPGALIYRWTFAHRKRSWESDWKIEKMYVIFCKGDIRFIASVKVAMQFLKIFQCMCITLFCAWKLAPHGW